MSSMKQADKGLTRRQLGVSLAALAPLPAQQPPGDELATAREQLKRNSAALRKFHVPTLSEPSFVFKP